MRLTRAVKLGAAALGAAVLGVSAASAVVGGSQEPTPPSQVPVAGSERIGPIVPDPAGGRDWAVRVYTSTSGASCVEVGRVSGGGRFGHEDANGTFHALALDESAVCGDLAAEPVIVAINGYAARAQHEARTVLFGRATPAVAGVLVRRRDTAVARPRIGSTGAFVLPLAGTITASALPVTITLENGRRTVYDWK